MFLVAVNLEMLAPSCGLIGDALLGQVYFHLRLRIGLNAVEEFLQKVLADNDRQHKIVEFVVLVDICKETADNHTETIAGNSPSSMFTAGTRTEVLACDKDG